MNSNNITGKVLAHAESVLMPLVPDAQIVGDELIGRNPQRNGDSHPGSFKINLTNGAWADFATDDTTGGDVYSFIAHCRGTSKQAARKWAKQQVDGDDVVPAVEIKSENRPVMPVPVDAAPHPGNPDRINSWSAEWEYLNQDGVLLFLVRRYDMEGGKKIVCWTYHDNGTWQPKKPPKPWPLYHLEDFIDDDLTLYLCEGEKAADAADRLLDGIGTCTLNGCQSVNDADLTPLHGRHVVIVPDADDPGRKYAQKLIARLQGKVKSLRLVDVWALGWSDGQDIADINSLPDCWDGSIRKAADWLGDTDINVTPVASKKSQATELVEMVEDLDYFHSDDLAYVVIDIDEHRETWSLRSKRFRDYLTRQFYVDKKKTPNSQAIEDALRTLSGKAYFECDCRDVFTRVGEHKNAIYLDMCNDEWQAIQVDSDGWRVVDDVPIRFIRRKGMHPLPVPVQNSKIDLLFDYINVAGDDEKKLILAWLVQAMRPQGPYPIIVFQGEQGTAKTTAAKVLVSLVDPKVAPTRTRPRNEHDLLIAAQNGWIISLDNLSGVSIWLSDALCRLATGGGFSTRELFTDTDEILIDVKRPTVLNGIDDVAIRPDLIDRSIVLMLAPIPEDCRKPESLFWYAFHQDSGKILGALLDGLSRAIRDEPDTELPHLPRMADFAVWATAAEPAFGYQKGEFLEAFTNKRKDAIKSGLDGNQLSLIISEFMATRNDWEGTMKFLLMELSSLAGEKIANSKEWPKTPRKLGSDLRRVATSFRAIGIDIQIDDHPRKDGIHVRISRNNDTDPEDKGLY